jgi:hypothetical protein
LLIVELIQHKSTIVQELPDSAVITALSPFCGDFHSAVLSILADGSRLRGLIDYVRTVFKLLGRGFVDLVNQTGHSVFVCETKCDFVFAPESCSVRMFSPLPSSDCADGLKAPTESLARDVVHLHSIMHESVGNVMVKTVSVLIRADLSCTGVLFETFSKDLMLIQTDECINGIAVAPYIPPIVDAVIPRQLRPEVREEPIARTVAFAVKRPSLARR